MSLDLTLIWALLIATAVFLYVVMDGFDLGVGILFPAVRGKADRDVMVNTVAPVWDGNETWLILGGGGLFAVFPLAYATILPALYMPLILMLLALVFRGVAFEMRFRAASPRSQRTWDRSFSWGSYVATFCQGICLGALVQGIRVEGRAYTGGWWDWLTPFSVLTGAALVAGYGLLGACWLIWKTQGDLQLRAYRLARRLGSVTLAAIVVVSAAMPILSEAFRARWLSWPNLALAAPVPALVALLAWRFFVALDRRAEVTPFLCALGLFLMSYVGLGISLWPMIVPPAISIWDAATHPSSQAFLLAGAVVLVPMVLAYTGYVYWLFRGKVAAGAPGYH
ncbi:cytochrome d ubiquinol oxidase subunit II [Methylobacterium radiotolerans]|uniref:cytochrome d ubiquinol oxidase subunit II n=1 Tax=Methylobacterium radiotolerans TaxID=31998 RepID=UPI000975F463|nr:cytochrome d ubiquinol oxidase subunit II [Methylobacterium radiotolerans]ONF48749.1 ubiquinol oxidase subunit II [Methylobacterium radiotolerans]